MNIKWSSAFLPLTFIACCWYLCFQQADGDADMKDGSFTEILTSGAKKKASEGTGESFDIKLFQNVINWSAKTVL